MPKKKIEKHTSQVKHPKERTEMVTPEGILIWVPEKKVAIKESWGWKIVP